MAQICVDHLLKHGFWMFLGCVLIIFGGIGSVQLWFLIIAIVGIIVLFIIARTGGDWRELGCKQICSCGEMLLRREATRSCEDLWRHFWNLLDLFELQRELGGTYHINKPYIYMGLFFRPIIFSGSWNSHWSYKLGSCVAGDGRKVRGSSHTQLTQQAETVERKKSLRA